MQRAYRALRLHSITFTGSTAPPPPRATNRALCVRGTIANFRRTVTGWALLVSLATGRHQRTTRRARFEMPRAALHTARLRTARPRSRRVKA